MTPKQEHLIYTAKRAAQWLDDHYNGRIRNYSMAEEITLARHLLNAAEAAETEELQPARQS